MISRKNESLINLLSLLVVAIVLALTIVRLFYGVDLTDEAYTVGESYMVAKGALPFVNNWSQMPGYTLLLTPFINIFTSIKGGTEGIVLFFRFLSFAIHLITAIIIALIIRKRVDSFGIRILLVLIYVGASGWDYGVALRGDRLGIDLLVVGTMLGVYYFFDGNRKGIYLLLSGLVLALSVLCYPTFALCFFYILLAILILGLTEIKSIKPTLFFLIGAGISTLVVVGYLVVKSSPGDLIRGMNYLLKDVTYFQIENTGSSKLPDYFLNVAKQILYFLGFSAASFVVVWAVSSRSDSRGEKKYSRIALIAFTLGVCIYHIFTIFRFGTIDRMDISVYAMTIEAFAVPFIFFLVKKERKLCGYLMAFIWIPLYLSVVVTGIGTYNTMMSRHSLLKNAGFLLGLFVYFAIMDAFDLYESRDNSRNLSKILVIGLIGVISVTHLFNSYSFMYREESIKVLDTVLEEGPYKGLHTTADKRDGLVKLDKVVDEYVGEEDYLLAMDNGPFMYLMSEGKICAPSSWDQALYSYNFDAPDLYYDYFKVTGHEPTKIIYFNYGRDPVLSIDTQYSFNDFVNSKYKLIYEDRDFVKWKYEGNMVTCEVLVYDKVK